MLYVLYDNLLLDICELLIIFHAISEFTSICITVYKNIAIGQNIQGPQENSADQSDVSDIYIIFDFQPTFNEAFNTTSQPLDWASGLLDADGNQTKKYDDILNDLLKYDEDSVKRVIVQVNTRQSW